MNSWYFFIIIILCCRLTIPFASAQAKLHFGIEAGVPFTDTLASSSRFSATPTDSTLDRYNSVTKRLLIGPVVRLELEHGLGIEFDALYQRVNYDHVVVTSASTLLDRSFEQGTANRWQFPLLVQYRWNMAEARPFVEAGPSISRIVNLRSTITSAMSSPAASLYPLPSSSSSSTASGPGSTWAGVTMGGGVDLPFFRLHLRPEFRYSHWFQQNNGQSAVGFLSVGGLLLGGVAPSAPLRVDQNEAVFLLGLTF